MLIFKNKLLFAICFVVVTTAALACYLNAGSYNLYKRQQQRVKTLDIVQFKKSQNLAVVVQKKILELELTLSDNPDNAKNWRQLGHLYTLMQNHTEAKRAFANAVQLQEK